MDRRTAGVTRALAAQALLQDAIGNVEHAQRALCSVVGAARAHGRLSSVVREIKDAIYELTEAEEMGGISLDHEPRVANEVRWKHLADRVRP